MVGRNVISEVGRRIMKSLGNKNWNSYTSHTMRRSGATWLASQGISVHGLCLWGNWANVKTAMGYIDLCSTSKAKENSLFNGIEVCFFEEFWRIFE